MRVFVYLLALLTGVIVSQPAQASERLDAPAAIDAVEALEKVACGEAKAYNAAAILALNHIVFDDGKSAAFTFPVVQEISVTTPVSRAERLLE